MGFRWIAALCVLLAAMAASAHADSVADVQAFQNVADSCGKTSRFSYSAADYVKGKAAADREIARLQKKGSSYAARITEIRLSRSRLKECEQEEKAKFPVPPYKDCATFRSDAKNFTFWAAKARLEKAATEADVQRIRQSFRPLADQCLREIMKDCIDPLNTKAVLDAVDAVETAYRFTDVYTYSRKNGAERAIIKNNPWNLTLTFCTDTDFACKGGTEVCGDRVPRIKEAFQTYVER